jgi:hypothetical protein
MGEWRFSSTIVDLTCGLEGAQTSDSRPSSNCPLDRGKDRPQQIIPFAWTNGENAYKIEVVSEKEVYHFESTDRRC